MLVWGLETSSQPGGRWNPQGPVPSGCAFARARWACSLPDLLAT